MLVHLLSVHPYKYYIPRNIDCTFPACHFLFSVTINKISNCNLRTQMGAKTLLIILLPTIFVSSAEGHPTGAPLIACEQMKPFHPPTTTYGTPPFAVDVSDIYYVPGYEITGTILENTR